MVFGWSSFGVGLFEEILFVCIFDKILMGGIFILLGLFGNCLIKRFNVL